MIKNYDNLFLENHNQYVFEYNKPISCNTLYVTCVNGGYYYYIPSNYYESFLQKNVWGYRIMYLNWNNESGIFGSNKEFDFENNLSKIYFLELGY